MKRYKTTQDITVKGKPYKAGALLPANTPKGCLQPMRRLGQCVATGEGAPPVSTPSDTAEPVAPAQVDQDPPPETASPAAAEDRPDYSKMKVPELREHAAAAGLEITTKAKKAEIVAALEADDAQQ